MLKVRLQRVGRRNDPSFRVVVTDSTRGPKSGNYIEMLGSYNPRQKVTTLKGDRIKYWISVGAKVSDTMHNILVKENITSGKKINVLPKKAPVAKKDAKESGKESMKAEDSKEPESEVKEEKEEKKEKEEKEGQVEQEVKSEDSTDSSDEIDGNDKDTSVENSEDVKAAEGEGVADEDKEDSKK